MKRFFVRIGCSIVSVGGELAMRFRFLGRIKAPDGSDAGLNGADADPDEVVGAFSMFSASKEANSSDVALKGADDASSISTQSVVTVAVGIFGAMASWSVRGSLAAIRKL